LTWNVGGILSKLEDSDFWTNLLEFDFVCLVETFVDHFENDVMNNHFKSSVFPARRLSEKGRRSGGVICLIRHCITRFVEFIECCYDNILVFKIDRKLFMSERDVLLLCIYVPPSGSPYYNVVGESNGIFTFEQCVLQLCDKYDNCSLIVCGDFNARTGCLTVGDSDDLGNVRNGTMNVHRCSRDNVFNEFGHALLSACLGLDLCILNGCIAGDKNGNFTFISATGNSVIDYVLVSKDFVPFCTSLFVKENVLTAHLALELEVCCPATAFNVSESCRPVCSKIVWDNGSTGLFRENLLRNINELGMYELACLDVNIDTETENLTNCFVEAADFMRKVFTYGKKKHGQPWFDKDCATAKRNLRSLLRAYIRSLSYSVKCDYIRKRNEYKQLIREKKTLFRKDVVKTLVSSMHDSSVFWRQVKRVNSKFYVHCRIPDDVWYAHFCSVFQLSETVFPRCIDYTLLANPD